MNDDFYVGWSGEAPKKYSLAAKKFFFLALLISTSIAVLFVMNQEKYIESEYEYGVLQERSGYLVQDPVWGLRIAEEGTIKTIPIVGFGKMGPGPTLSKMMEKHQLSEGTMVTLRGMLTHYQGKYLMELTEGENSLVSVGERVMLDREIRNVGNLTLAGEIVDPKCFFGVMNPAFKGVHRSCAIRCISGGMPPLLAIRENGVFVDYFFLHDTNMKSIASELLPFVGIPVEVSGQVGVYDDWKSITIDPEEIKIAIVPETDQSFLAVSICN